MFKCSTGGDLGMPGRDYRQQIETLRDRITASSALADADQELLLEFSRELEWQDTRYGDQRHRDLLQRCTMLAGDSHKYNPEELPDIRLADILEDETAVKTVARWIKRTYESEESKRDMRVALRVFADHLTDTDGVPSPVDKLSGGTPRSHDPQPDPARMLYWDDHIQPMLTRAANYRDKAAIALSWDLGPRPFEFRDLRVGDIIDHRHGMKVSVDGKTGERSVLVIPSVPYVRQWLSVHPDSETPTAPLWCKLNSAAALSHRMMLNMVQTPAEKADIDHTDVTLRRMRKSSASYLASQNVNQAHLEDHHGWTRGSAVASRYVTVFAEANDREIAKAHGVAIEESAEPDPTAPVDCPRCKRDTPRGKPACIWCGQALSHTAAEEMEEQRAAARESVRGVPAEVAEAVDTIERFMGDDAGLRSQGLDE
jgi:integrase